MTSLLVTSSLFYPRSGYPIFFSRAWVGTERTAPW